jgi:hypothetical protein
MKFDCQRCGDCCSGDWWDPRTIGMLTNTAERQRMADYLSLCLEDFHKLLAPNGMIRVHPFCSLFDQEKKECTVNPVKPDACRKWPFMRRFTHDKVALMKAARLCRGITLEPGDLPSASTD